MVVVVDTLDEDSNEDEEEDDEGACPDADDDAESIDDRLVLEKLLELTMDGGDRLVDQSMCCGQPMSKGPREGRKVDLYLPIFVQGRSTLRGARQVPIRRQCGVDDTALNRGSSPTGRKTGVMQALGKDYRREISELQSKRKVDTKSTSSSGVSLPFCDLSGGIRSVQIGGVDENEIPVDSRSIDRSQKRTRYCLQQPGPDVYHGPVPSLMAIARLYRSTGGLRHRLSRPRFEHLENVGVPSTSVSRARDY
ncbi:hypothetical protein PHSY_002191 [Pseudozyma hubeiensis SY62]|uniref:Uncharacterized protein n=1 Tax=Pseudozyma hubeiensis (strain SY62) TaxID=1305764 RepID=R9P0A0_PSEHS|nr:hypothetical protein PHSY_002191 [Pseudozyma hubeiensis SY62]GAC94618.1 hypothetical protein PHSY_002191 [Pseudozyma hubeiensis SY62]